MKKLMVVIILSILALSVCAWFTATAFWSNQFCYNNGWRVDKHPRVLAHVNGDNMADVVGFGDAGVYVALSTGSYFNDLPQYLFWLDAFGYNQGWRVEKHPRFLANVNNDVYDEIVGFGDAGVYVARTLGSERRFWPPTLWINKFGYNDGWRVNMHPRLMAYVNDDNMADIVGFGGDGVYVSLSTGTGFAAQTRWINKFGYNDGWRVENNPRFMAYVNDDNLADIVGFGGDGVYVSLSTGSGFSAQTRWTDKFDYNDGWRVSMHPRMMADVNGDNKDDIVGFGGTGVFVSTSTGSSFNAPVQVSWSFGYEDDAGQWRVEKNPRMMADLNNDGKDDIIGFANDGVYTAYAPDFDIQQESYDFGYDDGWRVDMHPRIMADVNGDSKADVVGFSNSRVCVALSQAVPKPINTEEIATTPSQFELKSNYPNPFNPSTNIRFSIPVDTNVEISIFNSTGQKITTLMNKFLQAGYHEVEFNAQNLPSGIYFYSIKAGQFNEVKKMTLIK